MENKFKSIWNSWVDWLGLPSLSPCLFVFQLQEGSGSCWLNRYLFCLPLQTSWRGSHCSCEEIGQTRNSCVLFVPRKSKSRLSRGQVICFIICYRGVPSYVCFSSIIIFIEPQSKCFTRRLAFGGATCPELLKCGWLEAAEECVSFLTGLDGGWPQRGEPGVL